MTSFHCFWNLKGRSGALRIIDCPGGAMARTKTAATAPSGAAKTYGIGRLSSAERSAYFARREAAKVLRLVLQGDAWRRAVGSIKSLVYSPSVRNKKATFALVCQTLKCKFTIKTLSIFSPIHLFSFTGFNFFGFICIQIFLLLNKSWSWLAYSVASGR